jgi:hypothetical protein
MNEVNPTWLRFPQGFYAFWHIEVVFQKNTVPESDGWLFSTRKYPILYTDVLLLKEVMGWFDPAIPLLGIYPKDCDTYYS